MSTINQPLKYLWIAYFQDGSIIEQPENDTYSKPWPDENKPSAFRDVVDKEKESKLIMFILRNVETGDQVGVDLETGVFAINGVPFEAQTQNLEVIGKELQIVFFREVRREQRVGLNLEPTEEKAYVNRYFIGWQIKGEDVTQTVALK